MNFIRAEVILLLYFALKKLLEPKYHKKEGLVKISLILRE